jgi:hypothetical protein
VSRRRGLEVSIVVAGLLALIVLFALVLTDFAAFL